MNKSTYFKISTTLSFILLKKYYRPVTQKILTPSRIKLNIFYTIFFNQDFMIRIASFHDTPCVNLKDPKYPKN